MKLRQAFRFYPTERQGRALAREFGCARYAYNFALKLRTDSFDEGAPINYVASSAAWTKHRNDPKFAWLRESSSVPQQQALRHLQAAFVNFFSKRSKYPRFHSKHGNQSAEYTINGFKWDAVNRNLTISKVGRLRVKWSRGFTGSPTTVTITKDCAGRYFVSICLDEPNKIALPKTGKQVGIDLGISRLATLDDGTHFQNPRHTAKHARRLARAQRRLSRKSRGSNRRKRQKLRVAKIQAKIADSRKDYLNKLTTDLVRRFDVIAIEDISPRNMVRMRPLAKHISCASFGQFRSMLEYKCAWYGRELRVADRFFPSSKRCSGCGHIHASMPLDIREFSCENCGEHHDRDQNAAKNIVKFAKATTPGQGESNGRGDHVRRKLASASRRNVLGSVNHPNPTNIV